MIPIYNIISPFSRAVKLTGGATWNFKLNQDHRGFVDDSYDTVEFDLYWKNPFNDAQPFLSYFAKFAFGQDNNQILEHVLDPNRGKTTNLKYIASTNTYSFQTGTNVNWLGQELDLNEPHWVRVRITKPGSESIEVEYPFFYAGGFTFPSILDPSDPVNLANRLVPGTYTIRMPVFINGTSALGNSVNMLNLEPGESGDPVSGGDNTYTAINNVDPGTDTEDFPCGSFWTQGVSKTRLETTGWEWSVPTRVTYLLGPENTFAGGPGAKLSDLIGGLNNNNSQPGFYQQIKNNGSGFGWPSNRTIPESGTTQDKCNGTWTEHPAAFPGMLKPAGGIQLEADVMTPAQNNTHVFTTDSGPNKEDILINDITNGTFWMEIEQTGPKVYSLYRDMFPAGEDSADLSVDFGIGHLRRYPRSFGVGIEFIGP
jgi:hypothetical protein